MSEFVMKFPDKAISTTEGLTSFFKEEEKKLTEIEPDELLTRSFGVILFFNSLPDQRKAGVLERLLKYLKKLKEKIDSIARDWGVSSYEIKVGLGVSLSLTFKISD